MNTQNPREKLYTTVRDFQVHLMFNSEFKIDKLKCSLVTVREQYSCIFGANGIWLKDIFALAQTVYSFNKPVLWGKFVIPT